MLTEINPKERYALAVRNKMMYIRKHTMAVCTETYVVIILFSFAEYNSSIFAFFYLYSVDVYIWKLASNLILVLPKFWRIRKNLHPYSLRRSCLPIRLSLESRWTNDKETNKHVATKYVNFQNNMRNSVFKYSN